MVLFVGQVGNDFAEREAFQEIDYRRMYGPLTKWVGADRPRRAHPRVREPRLPGRDWRAGRGPVVLALPEDMLFAEADGRRRAALPHRRAASPAPRDMHELQRLLARREAPVRDPRRRRLDAARPARDLQRFAEANDLPVGCARSASRTCSTTATRTTRATSASASTRSSPQRVKEADVLLVDRRAPGRDDHQRLHAARSRRCRSRRWCTCTPAPRSSAASTSPTLPINSGYAAVRRGAAALTPVENPPWKSETRSGARGISSRGASRVAMPGTRAVRRDRSHWLIAEPARGRDRHQRRRQLRRPGCTGFHRYTGFRTQLAPTTGSMGYGVPGRGRREDRRSPSAPWSAFAGDGDFLMTGQELATAVQYGAAVIVAGREQRHVRHHPHAPGARTIPGACRGTELQNPDFAAYARAFGGHGEMVERHRRSSRPPSSARWPRASPRSSSCGSIPRRSRPRRRSPGCAPRRWKK